jgi:phage baseplate assembly protein W
MVSSKNRNYDRNYGCNLVEITFKAIGIGARHTPRSIPVIAITSHALDGEEHNSASSGM